MVRVEVVEHNPDPDFIRVVLIGEFHHAINPISCLSLLRNRDIDPPSQRLSSEMGILLAVAFVVGVETSGRFRSVQKRVAFVAGECHASLVKTDDWTVLIVWFAMDVKNVLHGVGELALVFSWYRPVVLEIRF
jgi:hypothetical protein